MTERPNEDALPTSSGKWFNYSGELLPELLALGDHYRRDSLVSAINEALQQKRDRHGDQAITPEERVVLAVQALSRDVNNGGYDSFLSFSSGEYAPEIVEALLAIGAQSEAEITREALEHYGLVAPFTTEDVERVANDFSPEAKQRYEASWAIDQRFYRNACDLADLLFPFIEANRAKITLLDPDTD